MKTSTILKRLKPELGRTATLADVARLIGTSRQLVSRWGGEVPQLRQFQLRVIRPEWFTK